MMANEEDGQAEGGEDLEELALSYVEQSVAIWIQRGLPVELLADAMTGYGLSILTKHGEAEDVAAMLDGLSDGVRQIGRYEFAGRA